MTSTTEHNDFADIEGTTVFTLSRARQGFSLNTFCMALQSADNRSAFTSDEVNFLKRFSMSAEHEAAVLSRDYNAMLALGGNIYCLSKIAAADGESFQQLASRMTGIPLEQFQEVMIAGGRNSMASA